MSRYNLLIALLAAFAVLNFACGGDDDDDKESPAASARTATPEDDRTATPNDDQKSPGTDETPADGETPIDGGPARSPAAEGTPAVQPPDTPAFLAQFANDEITYGDCVFNPSTAVTDCSGVKYAVNPPLSGQDVTCQIGVVNGKPELIRCSSQEPLTTIYYDIQEG